MSDTDMLYMAGLQKRIEALEKENAELKDKTSDKWISCDERMPEPETMVIVACYGSDIVIPDYEHGETVFECCERLQKEIVRVTLGFVGSDGWYDSDYAPMIISPTFWQPLPEPPKEGDIA